MGGSGRDRAADASPVPLTRRSPHHSRGAWPDGYAPLRYKQRAASAVGRILRPICSS
jgi:hypothetical protein